MSSASSSSRLDCPGYIKSVFEKLGVNSRGELTAKLFAEHYSGPLHATLVEVH